MLNIDFQHSAKRGVQLPQFLYTLKVPKCLHKIQDQIFFPDSSSDLGLLFTGGPQGFVSLRTGNS